MNRNKNVRCCRETARRAMSLEILSTAAQLYEKTNLKRLAIIESIIIEIKFNTCNSLRYYFGL